MIEFFVNVRKIFKRMDRKELGQNVHVEVLFDVTFVLISYVAAAQIDDTLEIRLVLVTGLVWAALFNRFNYIIFDSVPQPIVF